MLIVEFISPISLPIENTNQILHYIYYSGDDFNKQNIIIDGFGATESKHTSDIKMHGNIQAMDMKWCKKYYSNLLIDIDYTQICAMNNLSYTDTCKGDSGSIIYAAFLTNYRNIPYVIGITSFGFVPCGQKNRPSVYTNVIPYIDWILNVIEQNTEIIK